MRNLLAGFAAALILTGCGLPPALTIASTVADGISYIASGKSVSDHAISAITEQDCAVLRLLDEREICVEYADDDSTVVLASAPGYDTWAPIDDLDASAPTAVQPIGHVEMAALVEPVVTVVPTAVPRQTSELARFAAAVPVSRPAVSDAPVVETASAFLPDRVTVLGSYRDPANAERALLRHAELMPRIVEASTRRGMLLRVVTAVPVAEARALGIADAWPLRTGMQVAAAF